MGPAVSGSWCDRDIDSARVLGDDMERPWRSRRASARGEVVDDVRGIVANTVDEVGVAAVLEPLTDDEQARLRRDAAGVRDLSERVERRQVQPLVAAEVAQRPQHRGDALGSQVEPFERRFDADGSQRIGGREVRPET